MDHAFRSVVTDSDRNIISQFLLDAENEMKEYQLEISRLKASVLLLENKREGLRKKMDHYRSLLSPIHRMPTEILARIFSYYCHDEHVLRVTIRPLALSQIIEQATFSQVGDCGTGMQYNLEIQPVTIKVRSLDVETYTEEGDADFIFQYCTLPELTSLRIVGIDRDARWSWIDDHIPDFLSRSCCSITELVLSELPIADWQTASLLRQLPTLKSLQLDEFLGPTNKIITPLLLQPLTLNYEPTPTHFLPELASLSLKVYENGLDHDMLVRALTSRWLPDAAYAAGIGVSCLKSITLTILGTPSPASNSALSTLDCLKDVGAKVVVEYKELQPS
ncbi:hypothetical protein VNI00_009004 [Paramarasmius palmivorus]|uniref:F-box domain-containing protein n=1 Tax=Paramarasmius palmivorus TaxID=297713 RepID=A0AAW0CSR8_9AGAR